MKILDLSAGRRAVWFDKNHPDAIYLDIRPEVDPTLVVDTRCLPADIGDGYDLIVFDPPHKNNAASGKMAHNYGHWTAEQIRDIVTKSAKEAHRVTRTDALMAFKWNNHTRKLSSVLQWLDPWWEPLFGHGCAPQQRGRSTTSWVMLRRRDAAPPSLPHQERGDVSETRQVFDPFEQKTVEIRNDLVLRLRGRYATGPTLPNGEPEFGWREFPTPPIQKEAADHIERLRAVVTDMLAGLEYLRTTKSVPYGFGIDRLEQTGRAALSGEGKP